MYGYSGMILPFSEMPVKNNLVFNDIIYRYFAMTYKLLNQVSVDVGQEFNLVSNIQKYLRDQRSNPTIDRFKSTKLTVKNIIEPMCVEVNSWINYSIKMNNLQQTA